MDTDVVRQLQDAGVDTTFQQKFPIIGIQVTEHRVPIALGDEALIITKGDEPLFVSLKSITALFVGSAVPPDFSRGPTPEYMAFFCHIELTAANFCLTTHTEETDQEFQRLYRLLWKRPDGRDSSPLLSYLQGAVRLYMSLRDTSRGEFEAVASRLAKSARTFSIGYSSRNYLPTIMRLVR